jgi:hypothetical protein
MLQLPVVGVVVKHMLVQVVEVLGVLSQTFLDLCQE